MTKDQNSDPRLKVDGPDLWCLETETRHAIVARRNVLLGLWAGRLMGKADEALSSYARELHQADFEVPGDSDIIAKLTFDFARVGQPTSVDNLREQIAKFQRQAWTELASTD
jgi:hypothetical protein